MRGQVDTKTNPMSHPTRRAEEVHAGERGLDRVFLRRRGGGQEAKNRLNVPLQQKIHRRIFKGVRNICDTL